MNPESPLSSWRFNGELRTSQREILAAMRHPGVGDQWHIVAPPGSGKTLIGLLLAAQRGKRTLVLAPTATIREQWVATARELVPTEFWVSIPEPVSDQPENLGSLTALTYQMLSVVDASNPFDALAQAEWLRELQEGGRDYGESESWLDNLRVSNPKVYREGNRRRSRRLRKEIAKHGLDELESVLHPNARELIARLVGHRVETIVLDECHHLLDHWALVVHCLVSRLREAGIEPVLIGLTATLPSPDDQNEFDNYTGLLGDVDYEIPTPAVVKEGNLAPYRDFAWFVTPSESELEFLKEHEARFARMVAETLDTDDGLVFLESLLIGRGYDKDASSRELDRLLGASFAHDWALAESAGRMLKQLRPEHPLPKRLGEGVKIAPELEQQVRLVARFALDYLLPDPARAGQWQLTKRTLSDFGYLLTDRGIRRGRSPIDALLATSISKDLAVGEIIRLERSRPDGEQVRAVVVLDFATHGHGKGRNSGKLESSAGALRCFDAIVGDYGITDLRPILVTSKHLRIAGRDASALIPRLAALLETDVEVIGEHGVGVSQVLQLRAVGVTSAQIVRAVSQLITEGSSKLVVGTRGLLGEGWDCPAVNTLIDLTTAATSSATQQLRGRTLRLDPNWPGKVAHNWSVISAIDPGTRIDFSSEVARFERKHNHLWGFARDGSEALVKGTDHALTPQQASDLVQLALGVKAKFGERSVSVASINAQTSAELPHRSQTRDEWRIGEPYAAVVHETVSISRPRVRDRRFWSPPTVELLVFMLLMGLGYLAYIYLQLFRVGGGHWVAHVTFIALVGWILWVARKDLRIAAQTFKYTAIPRSAYAGATLAIAKTLHERGDIAEFGHSNIRVTQTEIAKGVAAAYSVELEGGSAKEQRLLLGTLSELFGPIGSPRFLLEIGTAEMKWGSAVSWLAARVARVFGVRSRFFAVPKLIGRRRQDALRFAEHWRREVGACVLHEISSPKQISLLAVARRRAAPSPQKPDTRITWS